MVAVAGNRPRRLKGILMNRGHCREATMFKGNGNQQPSEQYRYYSNKFLSKRIQQLLRQNRIPWVEAKKPLLEWPFYAVLSPIKDQRTSRAPRIQDEVGPRGR